MMAWNVGFGAGKLVFTEYSNYTIPNAAVVAIDFGFTQLWTPEITHENRESTEAEVPYPGVQRGKTAIIPLLISGDWNTAGVPFANSVQGLMSNVAQINAMAAATLVDDGTQSVTFTPYTGATPVVGRVQMKPLDLGTNAKQGGTRAALELRLPDGPLA